MSVKRLADEEFKIIYANEATQKFLFETRADFRRDAKKLTLSFPQTGKAAEQKIAAFDGYTAYYGTYTVDEAHRTIIHHVEASLYPNWVGTEQRRLFEFSEGKLILRAVNGAGGPGTESRLVWERPK